MPIHTVQCLGPAAPSVEGAGTELAKRPQTTETTFVRHCQSFFELK